MNRLARKQASLLTLLRLTQGAEMTLFLTFPAANRKLTVWSRIWATVFSFLSHDET
jgi:hypothetical protein